MNLNASLKTDVKKLADIVRGLNPTDQARLAADLFILKLWKFPFSIWAPVSFVKLVKGEVGVYNFFFQFYARAPEIHYSWNKEFADWIENGQDESDDWFNSAGGFNQEELDKLLNRATYLKELNNG